MNTIHSQIVSISLDQVSEYELNFDAKMYYLNLQKNTEILSLVVAPETENESEKQIILMELWFRSWLTSTNWNWFQFKPVSNDWNKYFILPSVAELSLGWFEL